MKSERCGMCGLFACAHIKEKLETESNLSRLSPAFPVANETFSLGEQVGDAMQDFSSGVNRKNTSSTIPMGATPAAKEVSRIIIPPPAPVGRIPGISVFKPNSITPAAKQYGVGPDVNRTFRTENEYQLPLQPTPVNKELQIRDQSQDWVNCNICTAKVNVKYLDNHLKVHTHQFEPTSAVTATSTALVRTASSSVSTGTGSTIITPYKKEDKRPQLSKKEVYRFRQLEQACCASSVSFDGRYNDFTIIFWEKEKPGVTSSTFTGGTSYTTKEWERFSIHIVYDKLEDYYTVSSKLLKRGFSSYDSEDTVPDRICYQDELFTEIKRALLFFRISPMAAYKHFRKLFNQPFVIDYDKNGKALVVQTKNCALLQERLKKTVTSSSGSFHGYEHSYD